VCAIESVDAATAEVKETKKRVAMGRGKRRKGKATS
jgi:hypothetical protein